MSEEKNINELDGLKGKLIEDHEYDGIHELDNPPPPWWNWLFYLTIIWAVFYMFHYHVFGTGDNQDTEYAKEVAAMQAKTPSAAAIDEANITLSMDQTVIAKGMELFATKTCITCHGVNGEGNAIGPNLCDSFFIHGATPALVFKVVKYGVPEKGMTPFKDQLTNDQIVALSSYIMNKLQGSNPANGKAPQGQAAAAVAVDSTTAVVAPVTEAPKAENPKK